MPRELTVGQEPEGEALPEHEGGEVTRNGCVGREYLRVTCRGRRADSVCLPLWPLRRNLVVCS